MEVALRLLLMYRLVISLERGFCWVCSISSNKDYFVFYKTLQLSSVYSGGFDTVVNDWFLSFWLLLTANFWFAGRLLWPKNKRTGREISAKSQRIWPNSVWIEIIKGILQGESSCGERVRRCKFAIHLKYLESNFSVCMAAKSLGDTKKRCGQSTGLFSFQFADSEEMP